MLGKQPNLRVRKFVPLHMVGAIHIIAKFSSCNQIRSDSDGSIAKAQSVQVTP